MGIFGAIQNNDTKRVKSILQKDKKNVNKQQNDETPLHVASEIGNNAIVKLLLKYKASVNAEESSGWSPLHTACYYGHSDVVVTLIKHGANTMKSCNLGNTPLHVASYAGNISIIQILRSHGVRMNAVNSDGWTSLHRAASSRKLEVIRYLMDKGIDSNMKTNKGKTADELAKSMGYFDICNFIKQYAKTSTRYVGKSISKKTDKYSVNAITKGSDDEDDFNSDTNSKEKKQSLFFNKDFFNYQSDKSPKETLKTSKSSKMDSKPGALEKTRERFEQYKTVVKRNARINNPLSFKTRATEKRANTGRDDENECPICFEIPLPPVHIYQCNNGHIYCGKCKGMPNMDKCPQCGISIAGSNNRNRYAEENIARRYCKSKK